MNDPMYGNMKNSDHTLYRLIANENKRQEEFIELIASESYVSVSVLQASASLLHNSYGQGTLDENKNDRTSVVDKIEDLCKERALQFFNLDRNVWGVDVRPYSGTVANFEIYDALLGWKGRLMGMDLFCGGHFSHGFKTNRRKVSASAEYFESYFYGLKEDGRIDYEKMQKDLIENKVQLLIGGASAYPGDFDYKRMREIADQNNAYLMADISHVSAIIACGMMNNPFEYCDVAITTVQKMLRGPKAAIIYYRKDKNGVNVEKLITNSVSPGFQRSIRYHTIAGIATALKLTQAEEYRTFVTQVLINMQSMCGVFRENGVRLLTGGTINHLALLDMRSISFKGRVLKIDAALFEWICDVVNISVNKNTWPGDTSALHPSGVRVSTVSVTIRGFKEKECAQVASFLIDIIKRVGDFELENVNEIKQRVMSDDWFAGMRKK
ncbi:Glycine/serine hydroxymethyltransferase [Trachipleistophora hominis]|uniref:glycine hydroxymethyltransferase n=1 Tax=Trachipleistophora hominis TaxID=72359 RepID=L7JYB7_TRAHO|nr:Glycine/serine hydroxymethyltransferase [Trachipleistophora hominis]